MNSRKYFYILSGILFLFICAIIAGTVVANMLLQKQSKKLSVLKVENESLEIQQNALIQAKADVEKYSDLDKITKSVVPQDKDQAKTVREIVTIAGQNNIPIKSVSFQTSTLGDAAGSGAVAPGTPKIPVSQVKPVEGISGVYTLEVQVGSDGKVSYQNFLKFLDGLEKNRRTAHVTGISLDPSDNGTKLVFNLTLNAYLKP